MFMANVNKIKYTSGNSIFNGAITNNNVALGVDMDLDYGPTSDTEYWQGVTPNKSGYTIYYLNGEEQPRIEVAKDDEALIFFANSFGDRSDITNVFDALAWFKDNAGYFITNRKFDSITTSGMTLMYDPGLVQSYPKSGTTIWNLGSQGVGQNGPEMTLTPNGASVDFVDEKGGALRFYNLNDGDGSYATADFTDSSNDFTYNAWFKANSFDSPDGWNVITARQSYQQIGIFTFNGNGFLSFFDNNYPIDVHYETDEPQVIIGKWHNVTVRHIEGETTQLYLDNVLIAEDTVNTEIYNEDMVKFMIGHSEIAPDYFDGQIGHVAYYNRALSVAEIEKNYNALRNRYYGAERGESLLLMAQMPDTNNYGYVILDAATGTASGPIDTGVDRDEFNVNDTMQVNHAGYSLIFRNNNDSNIYKVQFVDALGNLIDTYDRTTSDFGSNRVDGFINIFTDNDDGLMTFFDGSAVGTYTWDTANEQAYWDWNWDPTSKNGTFVIYTRDTNTNMVTWKLANAQTGVVSLPSYDNNAFDSEPILYTSCDFVVLPLFDNNANEHNSLKIYGVDGTLKHSQSLTGLTLNDWSAEFFGDGKFSIIYWNYDDNNVDYHFYAYNEETNSLVTTTHQKVDFYDYDTYSESLDWPNENNGSQSIHYMLYGSHSWDGSMYDFDYVSFVSLFDGESSFITNVLTSGTTVSMSWDGEDTKYFNDFVRVGDNKLKSMLVKPSGFVYTDIITDHTRLSTANSNTLGNDIFWLIYLDDTYNTYHYYVINGETGAIRDSLTFSTTNNYDDWYNTQFDTLYIKNPDTTDAWYMCRNQYEFATTTAYDSTENANNYYNEDTWVEDPILILYNQNTDRKCRVLSATGISNEFTLPESQSNGTDLEVGKSFFTWKYNTMSDNLPAMRMYDFSGNTLNDYVSPITGDNGWNFWNYGTVGNLAFVVAGEGGLGTGQYGTLVPTVLNTDGTTSSQTIVQYNIGTHWIVGTDYFWWDC
jgi:hypothetical protein